MKQFKSTIIKSTLALSALTLGVKVAVEQQPGVPMEAFTSAAVAASAQGPALERAAAQEIFQSATVTALPLVEDKARRFEASAELAAALSDAGEAGSEGQDAPEFDPVPENPRAHTGPSRVQKPFLVDTRDAGARAKLEKVVDEAG
ncbi:MAG: hypothetical protein AAGG11_14805, partial [Pseudomonadota bacterium]